MDNAPTSPGAASESRSAGLTTALSWLMSLFPFVQASLGAGVLLSFVWEPTFDSLVGLLFVLYLLPILCYRVLGYFFPLREGASRLNGERYSPWWGGHRLQALFDAVPMLEGMLRIVPGAYSTWLRLWGSNIGRRVHWYPSVRVTDRALLDIGHDVVVGHGAELLAHVIAPRRRGRMLVVRHLEIGEGSFVGAYARLGPGTVLGKRVTLGAGVELPFGVRVAEGARVAPGTRLAVGARIGPEQPSRPVTSIAVVG